MSKIANLPEVAAPDGTETVVILKDGVAKRATFASIATKISETIIAPLVAAAQGARDQAQGAFNAINFYKARTYTRRATMRFVSPSGKLWAEFSPTVLNHYVINLMRAQIASLVGVSLRMLLPLGRTNLARFRSPTGRIAMRVTERRVHHPDLDRTRAAALRLVQEANLAALKARRGAYGYVTAAWGAIWAIFQPSQSNGTGTPGAQMSTNPGPHVLMNNGGMLSRKDQDGTGTFRTSLVTALDKGETGLVAMVRAYEEQQRMFGVEPLTTGREWLLDAWGTGSTSIADNTVSPLYDNFTTDLNADLPLLAARNRPASFPFAPIVFGEEDNKFATSEPTYFARSVALLDKMQATIEAAYPRQTEKMLFFVPQVSSHRAGGVSGVSSYYRTIPNVAYAQVRLCREERRHIWAGTTHQMRYQDVVHRDNEGVMWAGAYAGLSAWRLFEKDIRTLPLQPLEVRTWPGVGNTMLSLLTFDVEDGGQLLFGVGAGKGNTPLQVNYGVQSWYIADDSQVMNGADRAIVDVSIAGRNKILVRHSMTFDPAAMYFTFGRDNSQGGDIGICNIRDNRDIMFGRDTFRLPLFDHVAICRTKSGAVAL
ncbi:hypothetical protein [Sphingomonas hylomeconis]|uniref:Sialate O-acetylesterase domain-containing protein n=1 Tax=Sphingomonas hylomeconis TaxID=1395958 RepID=A0ABV7SRE1_9SPHN|nr:hypothetical protein [Sphingomonas hylomeconis]